MKPPISYDRLELDLVKLFLGVRTMTYTGAYIQYGIAMPKGTAILSKMLTVADSPMTTVQAMVDAAVSTQRAAIQNGAGCVVSVYHSAHRATYGINRVAITDHAAIAAVCMLPKHMAGFGYPTLLDTMAGELVEPLLACYRVCSKLANTPNQDLRRVCAGTMEVSS